MWNGITEKPDSDEIFVCDTNDKTIVAFKRSPDGSLTQYVFFQLAFFWNIPLALFGNSDEIFV